MAVTLHYLLDTNICIYIAKKKPPEVFRHFSSLKPGEVGMSVITYGELYTGTPIGNNDLWIAAHALDLDITFVSNNLREFERVPKLKLENWAI